LLAQAACVELEGYQVRSVKHLNSEEKYQETPAVSIEHRHYSGIR